MIKWDVKMFRRFRAKVAADVGVNECWYWTSHLDNQGYGRFWAYGSNKLAHRIMHALAHGHLKDVVMHTCDNPACVNPKHLRGGTQEDNMRDCAAKGRFNPVRGDHHHNTALTPNKVQEMRRMLARGEQQRFIANHFGISQSTVSRIHNGATWGHLEVPT